MGRRFLLLIVGLMFVLTCILAEEGTIPFVPASAAQQEDAQAQGQQEAPAATEPPQAAEAPEKSFVELLLSVASEEIGYAEKKNGYTKFGDWSGDPYAEWCAEFLCWAVDQTDERYGTDLLKVQYPLYSGSNVGRDWFIARGRYIDRRGTIDGWGAQWFPGKQAPMLRDEYIPQPGDWMWFTWRGGRDTDHVAMVEYTSVNEKNQVVVHVIEGNNPSKVLRNEYLLSDPTILGYGTVQNAAEVTMRPGNKGEKVRQLQTKLQALALIGQNDIDGVFGGKTTAAVRTFQRDFMPGRRVNGIADMETQFAMQEEIENRLDGDPSNWIVAGD